MVAMPMLQPAPSEQVVATMASPSPAKEPAAVVQPCLSEPQMASEGPTVARPVVPMIALGHLLAAKELASAMLTSLAGEAKFDRQDQLLTDAMKERLKSICSEKSIISLLKKRQISHKYFLTNK